MNGKVLKLLSGRLRSTLLMTTSLLVLWPVGAGAGQATQQLPQGAPSHSQPGDVLQDDPPLGPTGARLEHMREDERRKRLLDDTAKLVELSTELKADVEKAPKDELSLDVVRKAAEIEKLAHDVKERMKS